MNALFHRNRSHSVVCIDESFVIITKHHQFLPEYQFTVTAESTVSQVIQEEPNMTPSGREEGSLFG